MSWSVQPDNKSWFSQGFELPDKEPRICYGICRTLIQEDGLDICSRNDSAARAFRVIKRKCDDNGFVKRSRKAQASLAQNWRQTAITPLVERNIYIVICNVSIPAGYCTTYALSSYLKLSAWRANHTAIIVGLGGGTVVFDPNWGCAVWKDLAIGQLNRHHIQNLIAGGYSTAGPVYITGYEHSY